MPRGTKELSLKVESAKGELPVRLGREPSVHDNARWLEVSDEGVLEAMDASRGYQATSLDRPASADADDGMTLVERLGDEDHMFETVEYAAAIGPVLAQISERDRTILHLRFVEDLTQSEIARRVGIPQMHVSRVLRGILDRLRAAAGEALGRTLARGHPAPCSRTSDRLAWCRANDPTSVSCASGAR